MEHLIMTLKAKAKRSKEMGAIGLITVLAQVMVGQNSNQNIVDQFSKIKAEFNELRLEREKLFVKKDDMQILSSKIDHLTERVADIQGFLKRSSKYQASACFFPNQHAVFTLEHSPTVLKPRLVKSTR
jgi:hypothetical protein